MLSAIPPHRNNKHAWEMFDYSRTPPHKSVIGASPARLADTSNSVTFSPLDSSFSGAPGYAGGPGGVGVTSRTRHFSTTQMQVDDASQIQHDVEQHTIVSQLRVENRNLRMRLLYLDELISKRGLNPEIVNDVVDLKMELDAYSKKVQGHQDELAAVTARHVAACAELDRLRPLEAQLSEAKERAALVPELHEQVRRLRNQLEVTAAELAEARRQLDDEQQSHATKLQRLRDDNERVSHQLRNASVDLQERWSSERTELSKREAARVADFELARSELQSMVQHKAAALLAVERELDSQNARVSELTSDCARLKRLLSDCEADSDAARADADAYRVKLRELAESHRFELTERDKKIAGLEANAAELSHSAAASEETVSVYKTHFQRLADAWKQQSSTSIRGHPVMGSHELVSAGTSSTAADMTASVLRLMIDECTSLARQEATRGHTIAVEALSRLFASHNIAFEDSQNMALSRLRRLLGKIGDVAESANMILQRRRRAAAHASSRTTKLRDFVDNLSDQLRTAQRSVHTLTIENQALRDDAQRLASDRTADATAQLLGTALEQTRVSLIEVLRAAAGDMRQSAISTSVLTTDFLESVKNTVAKAHRLAEAIHDTVSMARSAGSNPFPGAQPELQTSGGISARTLTLEQLIKNTANICVLLETNLVQAREAELRQRSALSDWEGRVAHLLSRSLESFGTPQPTGKSSGGGAYYPQSHGALASTRSASRQTQGFEANMQSSGGPQYVKRSSPDAVTPGGQQALFERVQYLHLASGIDGASRTASF